VLRQCLALAGACPYACDRIDGHNKNVVLPITGISCTGRVCFPAERRLGSYEAVMQTLTFNRSIDQLEANLISCPAPQ